MTSQTDSDNKNKQDACSTFVPFSYSHPLHITERSLPHWQQKGTTYFITFRLADSIPIDVIKKIKAECELWLKQHSEPYFDDEWCQYNKLFSERIQNLLDAGSGSFILKNKAVLDIVKNALLHFEGKRYKLGEWVIMPNHVHVLVKPLNSWPIEKITHSWKSFTANEINIKIGKTGIVWQHESYDHIVRSEKQLSLIELYIINNPKECSS